MNAKQKGALVLSIPYSRTVVGSIPWYSVLIALGVLCAVLLAEKEERRLSLPRDTALDLALVVVPCGIVGARLYYVLMRWEDFAPNPLSVLYVWQGGIAIYGAVLGGIAGVLLYARRKKLPFAVLVDIIAPGLLLAQAIGRWGNYFNMEAYGPELTQAAYMFFPLGVQIPTAEGWTWHMATFFYESLWNFGGFLYLWRSRRQQRQAGNTFLWYLLIYGCGRFVIEQLRQDSLYIGALRASQWLSLILCALSAFLLVYRACKENGPAAFRRSFPVCAAAAVCAIARMLLVGRPLGYLAAAAAAVVLLCVPVLHADAACQKRAALLIPLAVLDVLCLYLAVGQPSDPVLTLLHALVCSLTVPVLIRQLTAAVQAAKNHPVTKEEEDPCPSES